MQFFLRFFRGNAVNGQRLITQSVESGLRVIQRKLIRVGVLTRAVLLSPHPGGKAKLLQFTVGNDGTRTSPIKQPRMILKAAIGATKKGSVGIDVEVFWGSHMWTNVDAGKG